MKSQLDDPVLIVLTYHIIIYYALILWSLFNLFNQYNNGT